MWLASSAKHLTVLTFEIVSSDRELIVLLAPYDAIDDFYIYARAHLVPMSEGKRQTSKHMVM